MISRTVLTTCTISSKASLKHCLKELQGLEPIPEENTAKLGLKSPKSLCNGIHSITTVTCHNETVILELFIVHLFTPTWTWAICVRRNQPRSLAGNPHVKQCLFLNQILPIKISMLIHMDVGRYKDPCLVWRHASILTIKPILSVIS